MKDEYDFSGGQRGKFYNPQAKSNLPIYLDVEVSNFLSDKADEKGVEVGILVNELLKKDIAMLKSFLK